MTRQSWWQSLYSQTYLALQILFAAEMRRRLPQDARVAIFACHPGECTTDIVRTLPKPLRALYHLIIPPFLITPERGEQPETILLHCCLYGVRGSSASARLFPAFRLIGVAGAVFLSCRMRGKKREESTVWRCVPMLPCCGSGSTELTLTLLRIPSNCMVLSRTLLYLR
jgi:hypothetical protein